MLLFALKTCSAEWRQIATKQVSLSCKRGSLFSSQVANSDFCCKLVKTKCDLVFIYLRESSSALEQLLWNPPVANNKPGPTPIAGLLKNPIGFPSLPARPRSPKQLIYIVAARKLHFLLKQNYGAKPMTGEVIMNSTGLIRIWNRD